MRRTRPGLPAETLSWISFLYLQLPFTDRTSFFGVGVTKFFRANTLFFLQNLSTVFVENGGIGVSGEIPHYGFCTLYFDLTEREGIKALQNFFGMQTRQIFRHSIKHLILTDTFMSYDVFAYGHLGTINGLQRLTLPIHFGTTLSYRRLLTQIFKITGWSLEQIDNFPFSNQINVISTFSKRLQNAVDEDGETYTFSDLQKFFFTRERPVYLDIFLAAPSCNDQNALKTAQPLSNGTWINSNEICKIERIKTKRTPDRRPAWLQRCEAKWQFFHGTKSAKTHF